MRPCAAPCLRPVVHCFRCPKKVASHVETWHPIGWVSIWFHLSMYTAAREGGRMNFKKTERSICLHRTRKWFGKTGKMRFHLPTSGSKGRYLHMIAAMSCRISTFPKWQKKKVKSKEVGIFTPNNFFVKSTKKRNAPPKLQAIWSYFHLFPVNDLTYGDRNFLHGQPWTWTLPLHGFLKFTPAKPDKIQQGLEM